MKSKSVELRPQTPNKSIHGRLTSDKFTFLKSNQLITKFVKNGNVSFNPMSSPNKQIPAYMKCKDVQLYLEDLKIEETDLVNRANSKVKRTVRIFEVQKEKRLKQMDSQVNQIEFMEEQLISKAADIMLCRNTSTFTRQSVKSPKQNLKKMGKGTLQKCLEKNGQTRKTMLVKSSKFRKTVQQSQQNNSIHRNDSLIIDTTSSSISNSMISDMMREEKKKEENSIRLKKLVEKQGFKKAFQSERRAASLKAFALFWKNDSSSHHCKVQRLVKKNSKRTKEGKQKRVDEKWQEIEGGMSQKDIQRYFDNQTRCKLQGSKRYAKQFSQTDLRIIEL